MGLTDSSNKVSENNSKKHIKVLFVCMGNICRSPSGEAVMNSLVSKAGLSDKIICDSAGTLAYHAGEPADRRMQTHAIKRGYKLTSISRKIAADDFKQFDYVIGMDDDNMYTMQSYISSKELENKMSKMTDFCSLPNPGEVPDPYYGGATGFEQVLDILEDACQGLLNYIRQEHGF